MMKDRIDFPDEKLMRQQINFILEESMPAKKTFAEKLKELYFGPGMGVIFYQSRLVAFSSILIYGVILFLCIQLERFVQHTEYLALMLFPVMHLSFSILSYWSEEQSEVVELKQTMKNSFTYIISLRMFYISIASAVINAVVILEILDLKYVGKIGVIGFSSMFVFAFLSLFLYGKFGKYYHVVWLAVTWSVLCLVFSNYGGALSYVLFEVIPVALHGIIAIFCFIGFISYVRKVEKRNAYTYEY